MFEDLERFLANGHVINLENPLQLEKPSEVHARSLQISMCFTTPLIFLIADTAKAIIGALAMKHIHNLELLDSFRFRDDKLTLSVVVSLSSLLRQLEWLNSRPEALNGSKPISTRTFRFQKGQRILNSTLYGDSNLYV